MEEYAVKFNFLGVRLDKLTQQQNKRRIQSIGRSAPNAEQIIEREVMLERYKEYAPKMPPMPDTVEACEALAEHHETFGPTWAKRAAGRAATWPKLVKARHKADLERDKRAAKKDQRIARRHADIAAALRAHAATLRGEDMSNG
jgi:hypothetical protein